MADEQEGIDRLTDALRRPARTQVVVGVLLALVGFAGVTQIRASQQDDTYAGYRQQDLIDVLNTLSGTTQRARSEIAGLERTRQDLQSSTDARRAALAQARQRSDTLAILAGLLPVTGPGIRITVTEVSAPVQTDTVLDMVEELRAAGAEAMQVNGKVRVVAQSAIQDSPGGFLVDGQLVSAPYVVDVIGDPHTLAGALSFPDGPTDLFQEDGADVHVDELTSLDITAVRTAGSPDSSPR
ncbi:MAG: DUF881 domain-containing protein [Nocardioides sp.]